MVTVADTGWGRYGRAITSTGHCGPATTIPVNPLFSAGDSIRRRGIDYADHVHLLGHAVFGWLPLTVGY